MGIENVGLDAVGHPKSTFCQLGEGSASDLGPGFTEACQAGRVKNLLDKELLSSSDITRQIYQVVL